MMDRNLLTVAPGRWLTGLLVLLIGLLATGVLAEENAVFRAGTHKQGRLEYVGAVPVMTLRGTPTEMGQQQAELVGPVVRPLINMPRQVLRRHKVEAAWPLIVAASRTMLDHSPRDYRQEFEAMVTTAGFGREELTVANAILELRRIGGCSTLYVSPERSETGRPLLGRNFDFDPMGVLDRFGLVIIYHPTGKKSFASIGFPGIHGVVSGMNQDGLCVATLDVYAAADGSPIFDPEGTPLTFCYRRVLEECSTIDQAEQLLRSMRRTTWANLAVADQSGAAVLEITPKTIAVRKPQNGVLPCTNHFRSPGMARNTQCWRYSKFLDNTASGKLDRHGLIQRMHEVNQRDWTMQSMIFEPADGKVHVALGKGPVTATPYQEFDLLLLLREPATEVQAP